MMSTLKNLSETEKEQYCENIYKEYVFETSEFLQSCDKIAEILRTYIPSGCYTNFRDMLFHFRCMTVANEERAVLTQVASIMEHASRARRDAEVALCVRCITVLDVLKSKYSLSTEVIDILEQQIFFFQDLTLKLRLGSMMLEGMETLYPSNEEFLNMMERYFLCVETYAAKEFKEVIAYSQELKEKFAKMINDLFNSEKNDEFRNFKAFSTYNNVVDLVYAGAFGE